jgi:hypothetical protein
MIHPIPAYLDPTSGSIAYQVAISSVLAIATACRLYWHRLKRIFGWRQAPDTRQVPPGW